MIDLRLSTTFVPILVAQIVKGNPGPLLSNILNLSFNLTIIYNYEYVDLIIFTLSKNATFVISINKLLIIATVTYIGHYINTLCVTYIGHYITALFNLSFIFIYCHKR